MSPEEQIRALMEENARLRAQAGVNEYSPFISEDYQAFQKQRSDEALRREMEDRAVFEYRQSKPRGTPHLSTDGRGLYMRKESRRGPVGLDGY